VSFRFSLAAVLRLREINEQREERLLSQILAQVAKTRENLLLVQGQIVEAASNREIALAACVSAAELQAAYGLSAMLEEHRLFTEEQLLKFEGLRDKQIKTYQSAHQGRELLSGMRQEQRESYEIDRGREQQKALDDMFIARRLRH
jgi:flagellar FliJ protein